jgi:hypothetical protein
MPTYTFIGPDGEERTEFLTMTEREQFLYDNPTWTQKLSAPALVSGRGMTKPEGGFRDLLKDIKKRNSRGTSASTVNTF